MKYFSGCCDVEMEDSAICPKCKKYPKEIIAKSLESFQEIEEYNAKHIAEGIRLFGKERNKERNNNENNNNS